MVDVLGWALTALTASYWAWRLLRFAALGG
jgi:hypothetical protein